MKRLSAINDTDMRKRTDTEAARPFGPLTDKEVEEIRQAYRDGCQGEIIIGLRGDERVITMLVPAQSDFANIKARLRTVGCNGIIQIRCESYRN